VLYHLVVTGCPGYYCPIKSVVPTECGGTHLYCPTASAEPTLVTPGYYTQGGTNSTR
jgi:hypothetical protein